MRTAEGKDSTAAEDILGLKRCHPRSSHFPTASYLINTPPNRFSPPPIRNVRVSFIIKFLHDQMQEQIDIDPQRTLKKLHKLRIVELRLQQIIQRDLCVRAGDHHVA